VKNRLGSFGYRIGILHRLYFMCVKKAMSGNKFPACLIPFMTELYFEDGITQDMLSARVNMDKGTTARAILRLEHKKLVKRGENKVNRREKLVYLTPKAIKESKTFFLPLYRMSWVMSEGLPRPKRQELLKVFDLMTENLQRELANQKKGRG
jgi:DNA-binding MarR family transcriptional regulator